ncbi:hypothetical protein CR513_05942, partial [Mucuna pruriens]
MDVGKALNALRHKIGTVLISPQNDFISFTTRLGFNYVNNMTDYEACAIGVLAALEFKDRILELKGDWKTRDANLISYHCYIKGLMEQFDKITFHNILYEDNQLIDALTALISMFMISQGRDVPLIKIQNQDQPTNCQAIEEEPNRNPWFYDIKPYMKDKEYPLGASKNDKRTLRRLAMGFLLRNHGMILLWFVDMAKAKEIVKEVHEGSFGTHANGHAMARKILSVGYYWLNMEIDCCGHVRKCHKCQTYADNIHAPPIPLNVLAAPWPF